jgi:hypothetical protein
MDDEGCKRFPVRMRLLYVKQLEVSVRTPSLERAKSLKVVEPWEVWRTFLVGPVPRARGGLAKWRRSIQSIAVRERKFGQTSFPLERLHHNAPHLAVLGCPS